MNVENLCKVFENFKIDLIYYNTQTDFEMEFNLCGCCRMRTFNDKCTDKNSPDNKS